MENLIPLNQDNPENPVSARILHTFLESKQQFSDWIKARIEKYGFVEDIDFTIHKVMNGKNWQVEYALTLDTAKEIAMVEGSEKGKQARRYFINCEKQLKAILHSYQIEDPIARAEKWIEEQKEKRRLEQENQNLNQELDRIEPIKQAYQHLLDGEGEYELGEVAKMFKTGLHKLAKWLRENKIFMSGKTIPYQEYIDKNWFRVVSTRCADGKYRSQALTTNKGLAGLRTKYFKQESNYPLLNT